MNPVRTNKILPKLAPDHIRRHFQLLGHSGFGCNGVAYIPAPAHGSISGSSRYNDTNCAGKLQIQHQASLSVFNLARRTYSTKPPIAGVLPEKQVRCACDADIEYITCLFFDLDVVSPQHRQGYPASSDELKHTFTVTQTLASTSILKDHAAICQSGNGHYVLAPIVPLTVEDQIPWQFTRFCQHLINEHSFDTDRVRSDSVYNLSRVMRVMGTMNRKGKPRMPSPAPPGHFFLQTLM